MTDEEKTLDELEATIPPLTAEAVKKAYADALRAGRTVVISEVLEDGRCVLLEVSTDGSRRVIKEIEPPTPVKAGTKFRLR